MLSRTIRLAGRFTALFSIASLLALLQLTTADAASEKGAARAETPAPIEDRMTLTCTWGTSTFMEARADGIRTETDKGSGTLTFSVIDGQLTVTGKAGGEKLTLLGSAPASRAMFFAEVTSIRNIILWTFYRLNDGRMLFIKQNNYAPMIAVDDGVHIYSHAGYCNVTGGNGHPVSK